ncbi:MAG: hypothetical protein JWP87_3085 [Labilithrix sp.]|nr:hypothetical protein [Labilithrix sp.]
MKLTFRVLAALAALAFALVLGWGPAPASGGKHGAMSVTSPRASAHRAADARRHANAALHARAALHALEHDAGEHAAIDDDDVYDDDDGNETGMVAPEHRERDNEAAPREPVPAQPRVAWSEASSTHLTPRGIRPSGEHRDTTDRPPRA